MNDREIRAEGEQLLLALLEDPLAIAKAIKERNFVALAGAAEIANRDIPPKMALTHPGRYRSLRDAVSRFHLKGYGILDQALLRRQAVELSQTVNG